MKIIFIGEVFMMAEILKKDIVVFSVFLGGRLYDYRDLEAFTTGYCLRSYGSLFEPCFENVEESLAKAIIEARKRVKYFVEKDKDPLVIFLVLTEWTAREVEMICEFVEYASGARENVFVYPIIWDAFAGDSELYKDGRAVHLFFDSDTQTAGAARLNAFMSRIAGYDLDSNIFPVYDMGVANQIAKYINRESFNSFGRKAGSIPKYPIVNGRPVFPGFEVEVACPGCGGRIIIPRKSCDNRGGVIMECEYPCRQDYYFKGIAEQFGEWPGYEAFMKEGE